MKLVTIAKNKTNLDNVFKIVTKTKQKRKNKVTLKIIISKKLIKTLSYQKFYYALYKYSQLTKFFILPLY